MRRWHLTLVLAGLASGAAWWAPSALPEAPPAKPTAQRNCGATESHGIPATSGELKVAVVLDTSASMTGRPLRVAEELLAEVADRLTPGDSFALISAGDDATVLIPPRSWDQDGAAHLRATLAELYEGGSSDLTAGLLAARRELQQGGEPAGHVLLMTDGQPTEEVQFLSGGSPVGVRLSVVQLGAATSQTPVLSRLARDSGGQHYTVPYEGTARVTAETFTAEVKWVEALRNPPGPAAMPACDKPLVPAGSKEHARALSR